MYFNHNIGKPRVDRDIDSDFRTDIREKCTQYCEAKYGKEKICKIMTKSYQQAKGCLRLASRYLCAEEIAHDPQLAVTNLDLDEKQKSSKKSQITSKWIVIGDNLAKKVDSDDNPFAIVDEEEEETTEDVEAVDDTKKLDEIEDTNLLTPEERECVRIARLSNGLFSAYGQHAAGVVISKDDISDVIPLMKSTKNERLQTQCTMAVAESKGLLKMDFLGLKNLNIITKVLRACNDPTLQDYEKREQVLQDPAIYKDIYCSGLTKGVFQFESPGMVKLLKDLQPDCFEDIIAAISLYRPGPMDFIPDYIKGKHHPEQVVYLSPQMEEILKPTYGTLVYQEQVMQIFQLAGYTLGGADAVRKAMSKKHEDEIEAERRPFIYGDESRGIEGIIKTNGISEKDANEFYDKMVEFGKYAFNKSHATAYALVSMFTAYEKKYHPAHFYAETLNFLGSQKRSKTFGGYVDEMKQFDVTLKAPDLLHSEDDFSVDTDGNTIYYGLGQIKGMSAVGEFYRTDCLQEFIEKNPNISEKTLLTYAKLGMFKTCFMGEETVYSREKMLKAIAKMKPANDKWLGVRKQLQENNAMRNNPTEDMDLEKLEEKHEKLLKSYSDAKNKLIDAYNAVRAIKEPELTAKRRMERYATEKELLHTIFSAKDDIALLKGESSDFSKLYEEDAKQQRIAAMVLGVSSARKTKTSGKTFYQVELMDKNGEVISRRFATQPQNMLATFDIQPEEKKFFNCKEIAPLKPHQSTFQISFEDAMEGIVNGTIKPKQLTTNFSEEFVKGKTVTTVGVKTLEENDMDTEELDKCMGR